MELWRSRSLGRLHWAAFFVLLAIAASVGCERDDSVSVDRNKPPETFVTRGPANSTDPDNPTLLYYRAHLFWRGEDSDGTVTGFRWAIDDTTDRDAWKWTTETDSIFRFEVAQIGAQEHLFLIRAVDNLGKQDATPDTVRFESFTVCTPVVNSVTATAESPTLGTITGLATGDTVEVFSDITVCWNGSDCDGFVVGWETRVDNEVAWRFHEVDDRCRTVTGLTNGQHTVNIRAIDDAGATSTDVFRFRVKANFDPITEIDLTSFRAVRKRPWLPAGNDLIVGPGVAEADTLPRGATIEASWSSTDVDGPIISFDYSFGGDIIGTTDTLSTQGLRAFGGVNTDTTGFDPNTQMPASQVLTSTDRNPIGLGFSVKGRDIYRNVELRPRVYLFHVNFQPTVAFTYTTPGGTPSDTVEAFTNGVTVPIPYVGTDKDSDPSLLKYRWQFSFDTSSSQPIDPPPGQQFVPASFGPSDLGQFYSLRIWAQDESGSQRESEPDLIFIRVKAPPEAHAQAGEGVSHD
jgi:hypothetical protein